MQGDVLGQRRAVEALRAGVPNRDVARQLPPVQEDIEERFRELVSAAEGAWSEGKQPRGLLIQGDFGTGKSHWLEYFRHQLLEQNFVCSSIVVSKETPLYDLAKVYRSCVESAAVRNKRGPALEEIALSYGNDSPGDNRDLFYWMRQDREVDPRLAATLLLWERSNDPAVRHRIIAEWTGHPMKVGELKGYLRAMGEPTAQITRASKTEPLQRFEFVSGFFRSAGYAGWAILVDEVEMISMYSLRQRGKAYANLAHLLGYAKKGNVPGLVSVFTITGRVAAAVLSSTGRNDLENIPARFPGTKEEPFIPAAGKGMEVIERKGVDLRSPTRDEVDEMCQKVRALYSSAYDWPAPEIENRREWLGSDSIRRHIRIWINTWDFLRLYGTEPELVVEEVTAPSEEDEDIQREAPDDEPTVTL